MLNYLRKITPKFVLKIYHYGLARLAEIVYGYPSKKMFVIGVTGTKGKTTTSNFICEILNKAGKKCALLTTANLRIGDKEWLNIHKQTMLGRFKTHRFLKEALKEGCKYAVVETSSEGILQYRHIGIDYKLGVFTGLSPEHLEAHGSFENYKNTKKKMFQKVAENLGTVVVNGDNSYGSEFLRLGKDRKITYGVVNKGVDFWGEGLRFERETTKFRYQGIDFVINLLGGFNAVNALGAIAVATDLGVEPQRSAEILKKYAPKIGRMEFIKVGQNFSAIVDYAHEPKGYQEVYSLLRTLKGEARLIGVLGSAGGGRDKSRRGEIGKLAAEYLDLAVVTNEDPYDEDPEVIVNAIVESAKAQGMVLGKNLLKIMDRREAIGKALNEARNKDMVIITGKGAEQYIMLKNGSKLKWDDREVVREILKKRKSSEF
jgi:UDP-N-acetylmuramoyl-L-alanyl-D-glutamate--2,6-diaminopimelate ligase